MRKKIINYVKLWHLSKGNEYDINYKAGFVLGIVIIVLIFTLGIIGVKIYKKSQKKTS